MSAATATPQTPSAPGTPEATPRGLTWWGVRTVALLEVRQRIRSTRWKVALGIWFAMVGLVTTGLVAVMYQSYSGYSGSTGYDPSPEIGRTVFGLVVLFVLFLGLLVAPTLTATTINGDRNAGTLAVLQATTLSSWDIAVGKLLASWGAALAFLVASLPFLIWGFALGGTGVVAGIGTILMIAVILAVVCAIGLATSTLVTRPAGSAVLTYVLVAALSVGTLIAFGLSAFFLTSNETVRVYGTDWSNSSEGDTCQWREEERSITHTERTAWLLGLNPFVMVADFSATPEVSFSDPLTAISTGVRYAQQGQGGDQYECYSEYADSEPPPRGTPYWPWSLAAYLVLGTGSVLFTTRRLTVPTAKLARGTRIA